MGNFAARLKKTRKYRNLRQIDLATSLGLAQTTIANYEQGTRFPDEETLSKLADFLNVSLDYLLSRTDIRINNEDIMYTEILEQKEIYRDPKFVNLQEEYFNYVLNGDKHLAAELILACVKDKSSARDIYSNVLEPSLKEVGLLWEMNMIDVAQEHYFSNVTQQIMSQLYPYLYAKDKNGYTCVSLSVNGEFHNIGIRMVSEILESEGWNTYYLGSDIPTQNVIRAVNDRKADILAISATMAFNLDTVSNLIKAVRSSNLRSNVKVLVGGRVFNMNKQLWKAVDADGYACTAEEAVKIAKQLVTYDSKIY